VEFAVNGLYVICVAMKHDDLEAVEPVESSEVKSKVSKLYTNVSALRTQYRQQIVAKIAYQAQYLCGPSFIVIINLLSEQCSGKNAESKQESQVGHRS